MEPDLVLWETWTEKMNDKCLISATSACVDILPATHVRGETKLPGAKYHKGRHIYHELLQLAVKMIGIIIA